MIYYPYEKAGHIEIEGRKECLVLKDSRLLFFAPYAAEPRLVLPLQRISFVESQRKRVIIGAGEQIIEFSSSQNVFVPGFQFYCITSSEQSWASTLLASLKSIKNISVRETDKDQLAKIASTISHLNLNASFL